MSRLTAEEQERLSRAPADDWRGRYAPRERSGIGLPGLLVGGLLLAGLGVLVWNYIGPDLKRYMKIRSM